MLFNTIGFFIFLSIVLIAFSIVKDSSKKYVLLFSSLVFVGLINQKALIYVVLISWINFFISNSIRQQQSKFIRKILFYLIIGLNILTIILYKLFESEIVPKSVQNFSIFFAIGLSYYTLQNIGFIIDTYKNRLKSILTFDQFLLSNVFFPKFIAGPIVQIEDFSVQLLNLKRASVDIKYGVQRILLGLIKKMVIADRLSEYVVYNFDLHPSFIGLTNLTVAFIFTLQLYFDFSGYTDIALGSAKLFGIQLPENFNFPLNSKSITEFWRKWHISLTSWLSKYIYYPLSFQLRKQKTIGVICSLFVTFLFSGFWHGLKVTFCIYAISHSIYLIIEFLIGKMHSNPLKRLPNWLKNPIGIIYTFTFISFSFIFFRSSSFKEARSIFKSIFNTKTFFPENYFNDFLAKISTGGEQMAIFNFGVTIILLIYFLFDEKRIYQRLNAKKTNWNFIIGGIIILIFCAKFVGRTQFIYSQF